MWARLMQLGAATHRIGWYLGVGADTHLIALCGETSAWSISEQSSDAPGTPGIGCGGCSVGIVEGATGRHG